MTTAILDEPMAKRADTAVKMDAEVIRKAKIVAAYRGQSLAEFLSVELGAIVDRLLAEEHAKEMASKPAEEKPKRRAKS